MNSSPENASIELFRIGTIDLEELRRLFDEGIAFNASQGASLVLDHVHHALPL